MQGKYLTIIFSLVLIGCNAKLYTYKRNIENVDETIKINFKKNTFQYSSNNKGQNYSATGNVNINNSIITFYFPPYSESDSLSPFKKGYFELEKIKDHEDIILHTSFIDLKYDFLSSKINNLDIVSVVSSLDSFPIKKVNPLNFKNNLEGNFLLIDDWLYHKQSIKIPPKGEYILKVYLQPIESLGGYVTTNRGCFYEISNPILECTICAIGDKELVNTFSLNKTCQKPYKIVVDK